jgi:biopolymer transport protein ExbD/biopolymer transport protein TolR
MQRASLEPLRSAINVTPLVDVVLVLLIIFMVIAPQLHSGPALRLPATDRAPEKPDDGRQILVAIERGGAIWVEQSRAEGRQLPQVLREAADRRADRQVVIQGDARLSFGEVQRVVQAVGTAGFRDVGLIAERREPEAGPWE